ncbi:MAG: hypothetical protein Kow006_20590 [Gammaproteobacteria bacterium]
MNRASLIVAVVTLFATLSPASRAEQAPQSVRIHLPPPSLAQWYKPLNKRQVWLHTMFRLRQALQAVELYAEEGDATRLLKWAEELRARYAELPEMVPEWRENSRQHLAEELLANARNNDLGALRQSLKRLKRKCAGCHREWKGLVTALYRSPDYAEVAVPAWQALPATEYPEAMERLADSLNRLKIGREDGRLEVARKAAGVLGEQLRQLKGSCGACHRDAQSADRILGEATWETLAALESALNEPHDPKVSGRHLGTLGFTVCGRCHAIHRTLSDLRTRLFE